MLTCIVICRSTDKKLYDNILKEPTISTLADNAIINALGGDMTKEALNDLVGRTQAFKEASSFLDTANAAIGIGNVVSATNDFASRLAHPAFMDELAGLGKVLCPSVR